MRTEKKNMRREEKGGKIVHRWGKLRPCATWCPLQFLTAAAAAAPRC